MIVNMLNHSNTQKKYFPNFCQITTTSYLKLCYIYMYVMQYEHDSGANYHIAI